MKSVNWPACCACGELHRNVGCSEDTYPSVGKTSFAESPRCGAAERMRTLAAEVWATLPSTLVLVRHSVLRTAGGMMPAAPATSVSLTTNSAGPLRMYSLP